MSTPEKGHEQYAGRLAIPYLSRTGPLGLRFRGDRGSKYLGLRGNPTMPYNVAALENEVVYITEGELDAVTMEICGMPAVGIPGVTNWKHMYRRLFRFHRVYLLPDGDDAGATLTESVLEDIPSTGIIELPTDMDVNSYYMEHGGQALRDLVLG